MSNDLNLNSRIEKIRTQTGIISGIVVYYAPWCPYCRQFKPDLDELANHEKVYAINISAPGFNIEQERKILNNLTTVPAIFFYKAGRSQKFDGSRDWKSIVKAYEEFKRI
jgi:thiol-disulfide isomerase/thioredoxin